jgi:CubicO group peptidase (beta-lactamase class C family)
MSYIFRRLTPLILVVFTLQACSSSTSTENNKTNADNRTDSALLAYDPKDADKRIDEFMQKLHLERNFNGNVLVAKNGKIIYQNTIGWADYLRRDSLKITSRFELASVSKPFTSTAILMLAEEGKLRLDQDVKEFFPDFPYEGITVKLLLTHRSGMINYVYFAGDIWKAEHRDKQKGITNTDVMDLLAKYKPAPYSKPNKSFHYNNSNFMVLGAIIEKVTGKPYAEFVKERIFKPCGMNHTAVYSKAVYDKIPTDVVGYDGNWKQSVAQNFLDGPVGDKGVYSTVQDLYLFDRAMRKGKLLKQASMDSAYAPHNEMKNGHFNYGYGWHTFEGEGQKVVYHTGWWHGFRHLYLRNLTKDITIILLCNFTNASLLKLDDLYKIVDMPVVRKGAYSKTGELNPETEIPEE